MSLEPTISGVLISVAFTEDEVTLSHKGEGKPDAPYNIKGARITVNGETKTIYDLRFNDLINLRGSPITRVDATR